MTDIDAEVAAFRARIDMVDPLDLTSIVPDTNHLMSGILDSLTPAHAGIAVRDFWGRHASDPTYATSIIAGAIMNAAGYVLLGTDLHESTRVGGLMMRVQIAAATARQLGVRAAREWGN